MLLFRRGLQGALALGRNSCDRDAADEVVPTPHWDDARCGDTCIDFDKEYCTLVECSRSASWQDRRQDTFFVIKKSGLALDSGWATWKPDAAPASTCTPLDRRGLL